jgi:hypothetical protein
MAFFDKFRSKPDIPTGYSEVKVDFTEEESKAINRSLQMYASIANANAPEGTTMFVPPKVKNAMTAQALTEYVEGLVSQLQDCSTQELTAIMDKAIKSQLKAYAIHNLPIYIFQAAGMFELTGDVHNAWKFFGLFLRVQDEFKPDQIDTSFLNQTGFDIPNIVAMAREKLRTTMTRSASLPIGDYKLDMPIDGLTGLTEFSQAEYVVYGRRFEGEKNYNAPGVDFLQRRWKIALGTVEGKVYRIALYFDSESRDIVGDVSGNVMRHCEERLGKPSEQQETVFMWDTPDGNVVLQLGKAGSRYMINLFETSSAVKSFRRTSNSHRTEWRTVPIGRAYWHPVNRGFTQTNAKFMCSQCGAQCPLSPCSDCGYESNQLGTAMGLPGVFCERCRRGGISWTCPSCNTAHKTMLVFYYDILSIKLRKKRFWEAARSFEASKVVARPSLPESSPEREIEFWMMDDALEMLKSSSFWSAAGLEGKLVVRASEGAEKLYETQEHIASQVLQWFKFRYFDVWQATGAKGSPFDAIDLTGADGSKQMERVTCWMTIMGIGSALGELAKPFGHDFQLRVTLPPESERRP